MARTYVFIIVLVAVVVQNFGATISDRYVQQIKRKLRSKVGNFNLPDPALKLMAILSKHLHILSCLPTQKVGNCYRSQSFCSLPFLKFGDKQLKVKLSICTNPVEIQMDFGLSNKPWYASIKFDRVVIPFIPRPKEGIMTIKKEYQAHAKILGLLKVKKAVLKIDATLRWDCTKPTYDKILRIRYNSQFSDGKPGADYNKHYYKLHVRIEFKVLKFWCFCLRCKQCKDLVNTQGVFGTGPSSCSQEAETYWDNLVLQRIRNTHNAKIP